MRAFLIKTSLVIGLAASALAQEQPPLTLAPRELSVAERQAYYQALVAKYGGGEDARGDEVWVIGLRGVEPKGQRHASNLSSGGYNDTLVVVKPQEALELRASTHAGVERSADCPWGVPHIRPGHYRAEPLRGSGTDATWRLLTSDGAEALPAWRDRDGSGIISGEEEQFDDHYGTTVKDITLGNGSDPKRPNSVGAQTLPPDDFARLVAAVGHRRQFHYLLIDANAPKLQESKDLTRLATPLSPSDPFRYYEKIALKRGVNPNFSLLVVALRGIAPNGARHASEQNVGPYNDTFLVLDREGRVGPSTRAFRGSLHAGQASTLRLPGVYAGVAQVRPGLYYARSNDIYHRHWSWHIVVDQGDRYGDVPAWRDKDKDGYLSPSEKRAAESAGTTADEILIHNGIDQEVGNSIGCFTMPPEVMSQFVNQVGAGSSFPFLLLDANAQPEW